MQSKKAIEIQNCISRNVNRGTHSVVSGLAMRNDDVEAVRSPTLKDHDETLGGRAWFLGAKSCPTQKSRHTSGGCDCERTIAKKDATRDHKIELSPLKFGRSQQQSFN